MESKFWCVHGLRKLELQRGDWRGEVFPRHYHESFEIAVVERGAQRLWCRGANHVVGPDSVVVVPPGETHSVSTADDAGWSVCNFFPDLRSIKYAASAGAGHKFGEDAFRGPVIDDPELAASIRRLHHLLETSDSLLEMETQSVRTGGALIARHTTSHAMPGARRVVPRAAHDARDYLEAYFPRNISLTELAQVVRLSRFRLVRSFTDHFGLPPHAYLIQVRVNRAKAMLAQGFAPSAAAAAVGFSDQSHLNRYFKRCLGVTPGRYLEAISFKTRP